MGIRCSTGSQICQGAFLKRCIFPEGKRADSACKNLGIFDSFRLWLSTCFYFLLQNGVTFFTVQISISRQMTYVFPADEQFAVVNT